jgi:hypothetical protein
VDPLAVEFDGLSAVGPAAAEVEGELPLTEVDTSDQALRTLTAGGPRDDHPVAGLDVVHSRRHFFDHAGALVPHHGRHAEQELHVHVGVAYTDGFDLDVRLTGMKIVELDVLDAELPFRFVDDRSPGFLAHQRPPVSLPRRRDRHPARSSSLLKPPPVGNRGAGFRWSLCIASVIHYNP